MTTPTALPAPAPGTVRRTVSVEVTPDGDWSLGLRIAARGRDLLVRAGPGGTRVLAETQLHVTVDAGSRITSIESALPAAMTAPLIGAGAVGGFRARLAALAGLDRSSLESAVLDELPTVRLISGYARLIELPVGGGSAAAQAPGPGRSPMVGVCAGWAAGATADQRARAGQPVVTGTPPAPAITSLTDHFHAEPAPRPRSMRRRRILDVTPAPGGYTVFEYFRDSHFDTALREGALHEYEVHARAAADERCTLEQIDVVPLAAPNAADLAGASLRDAGTAVRERLAGTRSCTHLNDTLRFLRYVPALAVLAEDTGLAGNTGPTGYAKGR
jgi:hypothetical protein